MQHELVEFIIKSLVEDENNVNVTCKTGQHGEEISVRVSEGDFGLIIGRKGRTIEAVRTLVDAAGAKSKTHCNVRVIE